MSWSTIRILNYGLHNPQTIHSPPRQTGGAISRTQYLAATQEHGANFWVCEQRLASVLVAILPHGQDIPAVGTLQRLPRILLNDEQGDTGAIDFDDLLKHDSHQHWRQAGCRLI